MDLRVYTVKFYTHTQTFAFFKHWTIYALIYNSYLKLNMNKKCLIHIVWKHSVWDVVSSRNRRISVKVNTVYNFPSVRSF